MELGLASCNGVDPDASIVLPVLRGGAPIATASIPASVVSTTTCGGIPLAAGSVGAGFFDLTSQCVPVTAGDNLVLTLTITGSTGTCSPQRRCLGGANSGFFCFSDDECQYAARVGQNGGGYADGYAVVNGSSFQSWELSFKTFVR